MNWINANERLPEDCNEYLVVAKNLVTGKTKTTTSNLNPAKTGFYVDYNESGEYPIEIVTHWMPLPEPPTNDN